MRLWFWEIYSHILTWQPINWHTRNSCRADCAKASEFCFVVATSCFFVISKNLSTKNTHAHAKSWNLGESAASCAMLSFRASCSKTTREEVSPNHRPTPVPICLGQITIVWIIILSSTSNKKSWVATDKENKTGNCDAQTQQGWGFMTATRYGRMLSHCASSRCCSS